MNTIVPFSFHGNIIQGTRLEALAVVIGIATDAINEARELADTNEQVGLNRNEEVLLNRIMNHMMVCQTELLKANRLVTAPSPRFCFSCNRMLQSNEDVRCLSCACEEKHTYED